MRVAFFGGSFNPPHVAHVLGAAYALSSGGFDRVLVVPVASHAFEKQLAAFEQRVEMCRLAFDLLRGVEVSDIEATLPPPNYTLHTLQALSAQHPNWRLSLLIGADVLSESEKWHAFDKVVQLAPPYVLGRVGSVAAGAPAPVLPGVSSTRVRELLSRGHAARAELEQSLPRRVLEYIAAHALYR